MRRESEYENGWIDGRMDGRMDVQCMYGRWVLLGLTPLVVEQEEVVLVLDRVGYDGSAGDGSRGVVAWMMMMMRSRPSPGRRTGPCDGSNGCDRWWTSRSWRGAVYSV